MSRAETFFVKARTLMGDRGPQRRLTDQTVEEALEAHCATEHAARFWQRALTDGAVTIGEAREGVRLIERALVESREVVAVAERAHQHQRLGLAYLVGDVPATVAREAADVGIVALFPDDNEAA